MSPVINSHAAYARVIGSTFRVTAPALNLRLEEVELVHDNDAQQSFTLVLSGPSTLLPQGTYELTHEQLGPCSLFLGPFQRTESGYLYQAGFNLLKALPPPPPQKQPTKDPHV
jgi:hypothetical protein